MRSCLHECRVLHQRFSPKANRFLYRIFLFAIDLDELDSLSRNLRFFSVNRRNLYSFRESDYFPTTELKHNASAAQTPAPLLARTGAPSAPNERPGLKARVVAYLAEHGVSLPGGRVVLVTLPRVFGYAFNPVSFYFCYDSTDRLIATLAEVTNTFREVKPYFLGPDCAEPSDRTAAPTFHLRTPKHFYVSPFSDVDVDFDFTLRAPQERISIQIDDYQNDERTLTSTLAGPRRALTSLRLAWFTIKYPLITLKIIAAIHWHALGIYLRKAHWFPKAARPSEQRDLYRPHFSIASAPTEL